MSFYNQVTSYPPSKNRLLVLDWASIAYHQLFAMVSKKNSKVYNINSPEAEIFTWKTLMVSKLMSYIQLFNPKDVIIALEGGGKLWRSEVYDKYYKTHTTIYYNSCGYYIKYDNFLYKITKGVDGIVDREKLDPFKPPPDLKEISLDKLPEPTRSIIKSFIPKYKGNRTTKKWEFLFPKTQWNEIRDDLAYKISKIVRSKCIKHDTAEGDDVIYVAIEQYKDKYDSIVLITGDSDCNQMLTIPNLEIFNHKKSELVECLNPRQYLEVKILSGDTSDNINGIALPGKKTQLTEKSATTLYETVSSPYEKGIKEGWDEQYMRNRKLIDMTYIPIDVQCAIRDNLNRTVDELGVYVDIYQVGITDKVIERINSMREIGYYSLHDTEKVNSDENLFKSHLISQIDDNDGLVNFVPTYGFGQNYRTV